MSKTPYIGFGNDTLAKLPVVHAGEMVKCPHCGGEHEMLPSTSDGQPTEKLMFFKCGETTYLGAVQGRLVVGTPSDVHGEVDLEEEE